MRSIRGPVGIPRGSVEASDAKATLSTDQSDWNGLAHNRGGNIPVVGTHTCRSGVEETMFHRALLFPLIFAMAVGPVLCCCSAGKASARSLPSDSHDSVPIRPGSSCCSHKQVPAQADQTEKSTPPKPGQPAEKCPCKDASSKPQTFHAESTLGELSTFLRLLTLDPVATCVTATAGESVMSCPDGSDRRRGSHRARLTTAELLYAHHNLRC